MGWLDGHTKGCHVFGAHTHPRGSKANHADHDATGAAAETPTGTGIGTGIGTATVAPRRAVGHDRGFLRLAKNI